MPISLCMKEQLLQGSWKSQTWELTMVSLSTHPPITAISERLPINNTCRSLSCLLTILRWTCLREVVVPKETPGAEQRVLCDHRRTQDTMWPQQDPGHYVTTSLHPISGDLRAQPLLRMRWTRTWKAYGTEPCSIDRTLCFQQAPLCSEPVFMSTQASFLY